MRRFAIVAAFLLAGSELGAQDPQHTPGMQHPAAAVRTDAIEGGAAFIVTGSGRTLEAIRRMTRSRAQTGEASAAVRMAVSEVPNGVRFTALAANPSDASAVARIRGLGFIAVIAIGDHHAPHHVGIANGSMTAMHGHDH